MLYNLKTLRANKKIHKRFISALTQISVATLLCNLLHNISVKYIYCDSKITEIVHVYNFKNFRVTLKETEPNHKKSYANFCYFSGVQPST